MRISLLLKREPFGQIIEGTLERFWQEQHGQPYRVRWREGRVDLKAMRRSEDQAWLCNIYLNAIFTPDAKRAVFDPVRKEFARSVVRWRRPLQRAYVALAASSRGAARLAQAGLAISPSVPDDEHKLLVAGNHKLRLLDRAAGLTYSILKHGFDPKFLRRELNARKQAASLGLPVPQLDAEAVDGRWFSERYVSGAPINRLSDAKLARAAIARASVALNRLLTHTLKEEPLDDYVAGLGSHIQSLIESNHLLPDSIKQEMAAGARSLAEQVRGLRSCFGNSISTSLTHGDFQPANILVDGDEIWLIDWEYSARRQTAYDALVFASSSRSTAGLAARLNDFVARGFNDRSFPGALACTEARLGNEKRRRLHAAVFLLEEMAMRLEENANPRFARPGEGLLMLQQEIGRWH